MRSLYVYRETLIPVLLPVRLPVLVPIQNLTQSQLVTTKLLNLLISLVWRRTPSFWIVSDHRVLRRTAKLRCSGSTPLGASNPRLRVQWPCTALPTISSLPLGATLPGASRRKSFRNSFRRDWSIARLQSVPAFLPGRALVGPRSFSKVAGGWQGVQRETFTPIP